MAADSQSSLRLVMMGTGPFAAPLFRALFGTRHHVVALITQPLRSMRHAEAPASHLRDVAAEHNTPVLDPENINTDEARSELARLPPDLFIVADYGQILSAPTLAVARLGGINLHGSLLPKYRGAAPINWALYHGDTETGVTVIHMTPRVDAGPALAQARTPIRADETAVELERRLAEMGAPLVVRAIDELAAGQVTALPQDPSQASPARRLRKTDGAIDWSRSATAIRNQIRALEPWPRTYTFWHRPGGQTLRLILGRTSVSERSEANPGTVIHAGDDLVIASGDGGLRIHELQPAGKRMITALEFLRGYPVKAGESFAPA
ncbi:MAG TPA: methionyl-tRNA formyltransferase [Pirellulales bacterium]|nr:methionyl-tRNA formyltransferase [Pirellulales bacterium]